MSLGASDPARWPGMDGLMVISEAVLSGQLNPDAAAHAARVETSLLPGMVIHGQPLPTKRLAECMKDLKVPGVGIAVISGGDIEWAKGYGVTETGTETPVTPRTLLQAASISKSIAALAAMRTTSRNALNGHWTGEIRAYEGDIPIGLTIEPRGAWLQINSDTEKAGEGVPTIPGRPVRITGDTFLASFDARIPTGDAAHDEHYATFRLTLRGERLSGPVYAESKSLHFWLPSYALLRKSTPP